MSGREQTRERGILRQREDAAIDEKGLGLVERLELPIRRETAVVQTLLAQLRNGVHVCERSDGHGSVFRVTLPLQRVPAASVT